MTIKKITSFFLTLCMVLSMLPSAAFAAEGTPPANLTWKELPEANYQKVSSFTYPSDQYEGFVIAAASNSDNTIPQDYLYVDLSKGDSLSSHTAALGEAPQLWYYDAATGRIYIEINGISYSLVSWWLPQGDNRASLVATQWDSSAHKNWKVIANQDGTVSLYLEDGNGRYYLDMSSSPICIVPAKAGTPAPTVKIYAHRKHTSEHTSGYAALAGQTGFIFGVGTAADEILEEIYDKATVWHDSGSDNDHSSAETVDWANVTTTWNTPLNTAVEGTYTMTVSYVGVTLGTITVTLNEAMLNKIEWTGDRIIETSLNTVPDFSGVEASLTYISPVRTETVDASEMTFDMQTVDVTKTGVYPVEVRYQGHLLGSVFVRVEGDPYSHLEDEGVDDMPEYPEPGAVRWDKTATPFSDTESGASYVTTGIAQLELTAAGMNRPGNVDVVLVVDVSNSMGWSMDWFKGKSESEVSAALDNAKIPVNGAAGETKLKIAMNAASEFASILLDNDLHNTLSFVTFAGQNFDNTDTSNGCIDSVQTPFWGIRDSALAKNSFLNTRFTNMTVADNGTSVSYRLQIAGPDGNPLFVDNKTVSGQNRGNTNYDYAFGQALNVVNGIKEKYALESGLDYDASGRQMFVVFMTDGAPSHYNDKRASDTGSDNKSTDALWTDSSQKYTGIAGDSNWVYDAWTQHILNPNTLAQTLNAQVDAFYPVGFDIAHGGFGVHSWDVHVMGDVLEGLVSHDTDLEIRLAEDSDALRSFFRTMANRFVNAGSSANVMDTISSHFTLFTGPEPNEVTSSHLTAAQAANEITVRRYALYTHDDLGHKTAAGDDITPDMIGDRKLDVNGKPIYEELEKVTFSADGQTATSSLLHGENILIKETVNGQTTTTIAGVYFTYTKTPAGVETFDWNIGPLTEDEMALSYYVYLKGSRDNTFRENPTNAIYPTNQSAQLDYVDLNGKHATRIYPVPKLPWGEASVTVRFYLVDANGNFINHAGQTFENPANRVFLPNTITYPATWGGTFTQTAVQAHTDAAVTTYDLYDAGSSFSITNGYNVDSNGVTVLTDGIVTKQVTVGKANSEQLLMITGSDNTYQYAVVEIPVVMATLGNAQHPMTTKKLVIDYGKHVDFVVFSAAAKAGINDNNYTFEVAGFAPYNPDHDLKKHVLSTSFAPTLHTKNGRYEVVDTDTVRFVPCTMLDEVEKVFAAVKVTPKGSANDYFYMFKEVDIIPATIMYYETDFADDVFYMDGQWSAAADPDEAGTAPDAPQDYVPIGQDLYGFDTSYADDINLSNAGSFWAVGDSLDGEDPSTFATFDFTGTGFDIIGRTGDQQGLVIVTVTNHNSGSILHKFKVLNKSESNLELYQIPIVSIGTLDYGSYTVTIDVIEAFTMTDELIELLGGTTLTEDSKAELIKFMNRGGEFYFDAVRIYNPINVSAKTGVPDSTDADIAFDAYAADGEAHGTLTEVRKELIELNSFNSAPQEGVVFVDRYQDAQAVDIATYRNIGPNNEVYLKGNQTIGFAIDVGDVPPKSIHIAAKSANGESVTMTTSVRVDSGTAVEASVPISTCTERFYDLVSDYSKVTPGSTVYVAIRNTGDGILSITDLKIAYGESAGTATIITNETVGSIASELAGRSN